MKASEFPWRKLRNAVMFAAIGWAVQSLVVILPAALAALAWFETDEDEYQEPEEDEEEGDAE